MCLAFDRQHLLAVLADAAYSIAGPKSALRCFASRRSHGTMSTQDYLKKPRKWDAGGIARFMVFIGANQLHFRCRDVSSDVECVPREYCGKQSLFQSGWFVVGLLTQTLIVHMIRTQHIPFIQSRAADAGYRADRKHHGVRHLPAILIARRTSWAWFRCRCPILAGWRQFCSATACSRN